MAPFPAIEKHVFDVGVSSDERTSVTFSTERQFSHHVTTKKSVQQKSFAITRVRHIPNLTIFKEERKNKMSGLKGKVVLITGASSGIGRGTAVHFATFGCKLSLVARNLDHLKAVADECKAAGAESVYFVSHDLATEAGCVASVADTVKHFGGQFLITF